MHIIRFKANNFGDPNVVTVIDDYISFTWIERYQAPGEFTLVVPKATRFIADITRGDLISHSNTGVSMVVESISTKGGDDEVTYTGRTLDVLLKKRPYSRKILGAWSTETKIGDNPTLPVNINYWVKPATSVTITKKSFWQIAEEFLIEAFDNNDYWSVGPPISVVRKYPLVDPPSGYNDIPYEIDFDSDSYREVWDLLKNDEMSVVSTRWHTEDTKHSGAQVFMMLYKPNDWHDSVVFYSLVDGAISIDSVSSDVNLVSRTMVPSKWFVHESPDIAGISYIRKGSQQIPYDGYDKDRDPLPTGTDKQWIISSLYLKAQAENKKQLEKTITKSYEVDQSVWGFPTYRQEYQMGDLVSTHTEEGMATVRVTEYTEILTPTSFSEYPTLTESS